MNDLISKMVTKNVTFTGRTPAQYTIQNCFDGSLSLASIKEIARANNERLKKMSNDDLFGDVEETESIKNTRLTVECLVAIVGYKEKLIERDRQATAERIEKKERLKMLKDIKMEKETANLKKSTLTNIDKEISKLEGELV